MASDLPLWSVLETDATLYQKDHDRFHLLLTEPLIQDWPERTAAIAPFSPDNPEGHLPHDRVSAAGQVESYPHPALPTPRLLWLELSPYRASLTMQGNGQFSYRHFWEKGVYGLSRYWLQGESLGMSEQLCLRNYTRNLTLVREEQPCHLRVEYELWANKLHLGNYVLTLDIRH